MLTINSYEQMSLMDIYSDLSILSYDKPHAFLELLKKHLNLTAFIPESFYLKYNKWLGRNHSVSLESTLAALLIMHFLNITTTVLLCTFLSFSSEIREYCLINKVPDESHFSRFKNQFSEEIASFLSELVAHAIPLCAKISESLPDDHPLKNADKMLIYDTTGVKPRVKENNPKFINSEIKKQKVYAKTIDNKNFNPYAAAYSNLPKESSVNPNIKLDYLNGHYGYFYKLGALTNGFGIPLHIQFYDSELLQAALPENIDLGLPEKAKNQSDNASLRPVLESFACSHPISHFTEFIADSEFDSYDNFSFLKNIGFEKVIIPLNTRNSGSKNLDKEPIPYDENGWPLCPKTKTPMIAEGSCKGKGRSLRFKFRCPKSSSHKGKRICTCDDPCTDSPSGRMHYVYPDKDFRLCPGIVRGSEQWNQTYALRACIERTYSSLKSNECVAHPRTLNLPSIRSDIYLAASTQVITLILAYAIKKPDYLRSITKIIRFAA